MSLDNDLAADVSDELFWDPKVDNAPIAVSANDGQITLRGTVGSLREKREAKKAAQRVFGVISVDDQLQVKLMNDERRADAELRGDVLQALMLDSLVPNTIDAKVQDGFVTLTGTADRQYQRDEAEFVASNIVGALDVFDDIALMHPTPGAGDVQESIKKAFKRNAKIDADDLYVTTDNGTVTINGTVSSWAEHDEALEAAWAAPGVTSVHDEMTSVTDDRCSGGGGSTRCPRRSRATSQSCAPPTLKPARFAQRIGERADWALSAPNQVKANGS